MPELKTYDPESCTLIVGGVPISGFADGTGIKVSRSENSFDDITGMDGHTSRARNPNKSGQIVITLLQTSASNDFLSALNAIDEAENKGVVPVAVKDLSGTSVYASADAWVQKPADGEFGKALSNREWTLRCANLFMFSGGNL